MADECGRWRENACRVALGLCLVDDPAARVLTGEHAERAVLLTRWAQLSTLKVLGLGRREVVVARARKLRAILEETPGLALPLRELDRRHNFAHEEVRRLTRQFPRWFQLATRATGGRPSDVLTLVQQV